MTIETNATSAGAEPAETKGLNPVKFQKLLLFMKWDLALSAVTTIIGCMDIREYYSFGRTGCFVIGSVFLVMEIWLYVSIMHRKSWARKSYIVLTLLLALFYLLAIRDSWNGNLLSDVVDLVDLLIELYCVCLLFTKEVAAVFKSDSELTDARAVINILHCIGYWIAFVLWLLCWLGWGVLYQGTEAWEKDCLAAAVAGSSTARQDLIDFVAGQCEGQDVNMEDVIKCVDESIKEQSPKPSGPPSTSNSNSKPIRRVHPGAIYLGLKYLGKGAVALIAVIGGFITWLSKKK